MGKINLFKEELQARLSDENPEPVCYKREGGPK